MLTKGVEPVFGDNVVNRGSSKLVFRKHIGEYFPISKPVLMISDITADILTSHFIVYALCTGHESH